MKLIPLLLITLIIPIISHAEIWSINKDHSEIFFSIPYLSVSEVTGKFREFKGEIQLKETRAPLKLKIDIKVDSIDTGNKLRDGHLKGNDFFQKSRFPEISFYSDKITPIEKKGFRANGTIKIKNIAAPLEVEFSLSTPIKDTWGYVSRFAKFTTEIKRSDFNISWNKTLSKNEYLLGERVKIWGIFQIQPLNLKTPENKHMIPDTTYIRNRERISRGEIAEETKTLSNLDLPKVVNQKKLEIKPIGDKNLNQQVDRKSFTWWLALFVLGFLGFISVIIISVYSKTILSDFFQKEPKKDEYLDYLSDAVLIGWVLIYSVSLWIIGWG